MAKYILLSFLFLLLMKEAFGQCNCSNTSVFIPSIHWLGLADRSLTPQKNLRLGVLYRYTSSKQEYENDSPINSQVAFVNHFGVFFLSYGFDNYTSIEAEISYTYRNLDLFSFKSTSYGFSNLSIGARRNVFESDYSTVFINLGGGLKIPLMNLKNPETTPVVLQPTNGAFGAYILLFVQISHSKLMNLAFQSRFDYNFISKYSYQFGASILNSIIASSEVFTNCYLTLETRATFQSKDKDKGIEVQNSGNFIVKAIPQIVYRYSDFSISLAGDFPFYRFYNGRQIAEMPSLNLFFNWFINFNRGRL
ncbi:MAG: hypothetical protein ACUVQ1_09325 [Candidatus Kapaibacteriales bacterium]